MDIPESTTGSIGAGIDAAIIHSVLAKEPGKRNGRTGFNRLRKDPLGGQRIRRSGRIDYHSRHHRAAALLPAGLPGFKKFGRH